LPSSEFINEGLRKYKCLSPENKETCGVLCVEGHVDGESDDDRKRRLAIITQIVAPPLSLESLRTQTSSYLRVCIKFIRAWAESETALINSGELKLPTAINLLRFTTKNMMSAARIYRDQLDSLRDWTLVSSLFESLVKLRQAIVENCQEAKAEHGAYDFLFVDCNTISHYLDCRANGQRARELKDKETRMLKEFVQSLKLVANDIPDFMKPNDNIRAVLYVQFDNPIVYDLVDDAGETIHGYPPHFICKYMKKSIAQIEEMTGQLTHGAEFNSLAVMDFTAREFMAASMLAKLYHDKATDMKKLLHDLFNSSVDLRNTVASISPAAEDKWGFLFQKDCQYAVLNLLRKTNGENVDEIDVDQVRRLEDRVKSVAGLPTFMTKPQLSLVGLDGKEKPSYLKECVEYSIAKAQRKIELVNSSGDLGTAIALDLFRFTAQHIIYAARIHNNCSDCVDVEPLVASLLALKHAIFKKSATAKSVCKDYDFLFDDFDTIRNYLKCRDNAETVYGLPHSDRRSLRDFIESLNRVTENDRGQQVPDFMRPNVNWMLSLRTPFNTTHTFTGQ
jgi:hypothetical protein